MKVLNKSPKLATIINEVKKPEAIIEKKYKIEADKGCEIQLPVNYSTDDENEKRIAKSTNRRMKY